ncbi:GNAT family N-acetyltransferase [Inconstantimicrobium mannanitabidum]|uniref:Acetyltransferase n=1 Tax=Inconstantimicrobium mannanitabidum TaxID=1604901 RepID=A0ACB5RBL0_9CLOT|nr:GNAT family N-acetyltransferase [Clostridium sp. TW13]GKX66431.1 acetyltransferase [Clostridium sp. TW13]
MDVYEINDTKCLEKLFEGWQETLIWSCLQGCMGRAYADSVSNPKSAQIVIGDFCFFAGEVNNELILNKPDYYKSNFVIMIPQHNEWSKQIEQTYREGAKKISRYAIKKEPNVFDIVKLKEIVDNIKKPFNIQMIDRDIFNQIIKNPWSKDLCSQFKDYEEYKKRGLGAVIIEDGIVVSGASSYTVYNEGIEIEIDTREDYRRKGLALVCGAKLILECLNRGLYPSWDAHNKGSVALAEKLGYHFDKEYVAYELINY